VLKGFNCSSLQPIQLYNY